VLPLHEIESVLCDQSVVSALADHLGKSPEVVWQTFVDRVRTTFQGATLNNVVARRVRSRVGDLLNGMFSGDQVVADSERTAANHSSAILKLDLPGKVETMFTEELSRVKGALADGGSTMLAVLPGKHLLSVLDGVLGIDGTKELSGLIIRALNRKYPNQENPLQSLGARIEAALRRYLPPRRTSDVSYQGPVDSVPHRVEAE